MNLNKLMEINEETKEVLTEPYQPILIGVKQDQWNALIRHTITVGTELCKSIDLISKLPTQEEIDELMTAEVRKNYSWMAQEVKNGMSRVASSIDSQTRNTTKSVTNTITSMNSNMMEQMKMRDLTPWKVKAKWITIGAIFEIVKKTVHPIWWKNLHICSVGNIKTTRWDEWYAHPQM